MFASLGVATNLLFTGMWTTQWALSTPHRRQDTMWIWLNHGPLDCGSLLCAGGCGGKHSPNWCVRDQTGMKTPPMKYVSNALGNKLAISQRFFELGIQMALDRQEMSVWEAEGGGNSAKEQVESFVSKFLCFHSSMCNITKGRGAFISAVTAGGTNYPVQRKCNCKLLYVLKREKLNLLHPRYMLRIIIEFIWVRVCVCIYIIMFIYIITYVYYFMFIKRIVSWKAYSPVIQES